MKSISDLDSIKTERKRRKQWNKREYEVPIVEIKVIEGEFSKEGMRKLIADVTDVFSLSWERICVTRSGL